MVAPEPSSGQDATLVEPSAKLASLLVKRGTDPQTLRARIHVDVGAVERVGLAVVIREVAAIGDPGPSVMAERIRAEIDDERGHGTDDATADLGHELPLWEYSLMAHQVTLAPHDVLVRQERVCGAVHLHQACLTSHRGTLPSRRRSVKSE